MAKIPTQLRGYVRKRIIGKGYYLSKSGYYPAKINRLIDKVFYRSKIDGYLYPKAGRKPKIHWSKPSDHEPIYFQ